MSSLSQTKNLVSIYQKLFNLGLKKYKLQNEQEAKREEINNINIRKCSGVKAFKKLLIDHPKLQEIMNEMFESGELLEALVKWNGVYNNMAIALKYFSRLHLIIKNPHIEKISWTYGSQEVSFIKENEQLDQNQSEQTSDAHRSQPQKIKPPSTSHNGLKEFYCGDQQAFVMQADQTIVQINIISQMTDIEIVQTPSLSIGSVIIGNPYLKNGNICLEAGLANCMS